MTSKEVLLITGANTGLGYETVRSLCQSSKAYTILLGGRNLEKAEAATKQVQEEFPDSPSTIKPIQVDIEHDESISKAFEQVSNDYGRVDVLINNAGKRGTCGPSDDARELTSPQEQCLTRSTMPAR